MIYGIQISNNLNNRPIRPYNAQKTSNPSFGSSPINPQDITTLAIAGSSATAYIIARIKTSNILKLVGEKAPLTLWNRLGKISELASKDNMTGLYNKAALLTSVDKEYKTAMKKGKPFSIAIFDMDNFKAINEEFGHKTGDKVLTRIASNIKEIAEKYNLKGFRYGGEEFVVTMPGHDAESSKKIADEIAKTIKKDKTIQGYLPEFKEKAQAKIGFLDATITKLDNAIFPKLRRQQGEPIDNYDELATDIISVIENHLTESKPSNRKTLDSIVQRLTNAPKSELPNLLSVHTPFGEGTLGSELDRIHYQYNDMKHDRQKWLNHVNEHKMFTISGGIANLNKTHVLKESASSIEIADAALKGAKENGKNTIVTANDDLIKKTIENITSEAK